MPDDQYLSLLISTEGEKAVTHIVDFMRRAGLTAECYAYKFRVKSKSDLLSKKNRKLDKKPEYLITDITDVIGIRLVTLFKGDMLKVYANLIEMLANKRDDAKLHQVEPEEIILYNGTSVLLDFATEIKSLTKARFKATEVHTQSSYEGYSSIHVICRYSEEIGEIPLYRLPVEIQIRTVFEDAWGEIDHKYGYVLREGKDAGTPIHNSQYVKAHLKVLKGFSDACMEYAECIRKEALPDSLELMNGVTKTISVESDDDVLHRFRHLGVQEEFIQRYVAARALRDRAEDESGGVHDGRITSEKTYLQAADQFSTLLQEIAPGDSFSELRGDGLKLAYYYCAMNEGLCLMSTNLPDYVNIAVEKYQFIETHFKNFPLAKMRLGQALGKTGRLDDSIKMLRLAGVMFRRQGEKSKTSGEWTDHLPRADYDHMLYTQPKILGYNLWLHSQKPGVNKSDFYFQAYTTTLLCLDAPKVEKKKLADIYNNLLYYCVGFVLSADSGDGRLAQIKSEIPSLLESMLSQCGDISKIAVEDLDTVFRAYALLKDEKAKEIAELLIQRCLRREAGLVPTLRISIAEAAQEYLDTGMIIAM